MTLHPVAKPAREAERLDHAADLVLHVVVESSIMVWCRWLSADSVAVGRHLEEVPPEELGRAYRRRWGIETDFRKIKHDFLAKSGSKDPALRAF